MLDFPIPNELISALLTWGVITLLSRYGFALPLMKPTGKPDDPATPADESKEPVNPLAGLELQEIIRRTVLDVLGHVFKATPPDVHAKIEAALSTPLPSQGK